MALTIKDQAGHVRESLSATFLKGAEQGLILMNVGIEHARHVTSNPFDLFGSRETADAYVQSLLQGIAPVGKITTANLNDAAHLSERRSRDANRITGLTSSVEQLASDIALVAERFDAGTFSGTNAQAVFSGIRIADESGYLNHAEDISPAAGRGIIQHIKLKFAAAKLGSLMTEAQETIEAASPSVLTRVFGQTSDRADVVLARAVEGSRAIEPLKSVIRDNPFLRI